MRYCGLSPKGAPDLGPPQVGSALFNSIFLSPGLEVSTRTGLSAEAEAKMDGNLSKELVRRGGKEEGRKERDWEEYETGRKGKCERGESVEREKEKKERKRWRGREK